MSWKGWSLASSGVLVFALAASACGGAAAPTATPAKASAATNAPSGGPTPTATRAAPAGVSTPTPTSAGPQPTTAFTGPVGKMVMAATADVTNLDVHVATAGGLQYFYTISDVNAPFMAQQGPGPAQPYLAESWSWDEKGTKVRFVIRKGAKFHDGKPVTTDDVKFTVEKVKSPYSARGANASLPARLKDVQAIDDRTVVFTTTEVLSTAYLTFGGLVVQPRHDPYDLMQKKPIGAGPYKVVDWKPFESMTLEASGYFWEPVAVKTIVRLVVPEPESRLAMLKSGQVDLMDEVQPRQAEDLLKDKRFRVKVTDAGNWAPVIFATDRPTIPGTDIPNPFLDVRVRRAFIMALDRKAIFEGVALSKYGKYIPGPWPSNALGGSQEKNITPYPYDPKAARKLLEDAKFPFDREWPVWYYRTSAGFAESFEVAVAQWNAIGIKARANLTEVGTMMSYWQEFPSRTYPITLIRPQLINGEPSGYVWCSKTGNPECSLSPIGDTKPDEWVKRLRVAFDPAERDQILQEVYLYTHGQALSIPLLGGVLIHAIDQRVDWEPIPGQMFATHLWRSRWLPGAP